MKLLQPFFTRFFPPHQLISAGIYHFQAPADAPVPYRLHLRVEPDGQSILILNASTVIHLNTTATEYAYHLVKNTPQEEAVSQMAKRYRIDKETVKHDYDDLVGRLRTLVETPDLDPVTFLDFDRQDIYSGAISAPYRLDCALTYRLPDEGAGALAPMDRVKRELSAEEWMSILDKAWAAGVPHVVFTGGEPTMRPDLCQLIAYGEKLGMVTGLITSGMRLSDPHYLNELLQSGLDHVMILLDPQEQESWEALRDVLKSDIAITTHLTLTEKTLRDFDSTLVRLAGMGARNISLSADSVNLKEELKAKRQVVAEKHLRLVWDLPVPYSRFHPVALELADNREGGSPDVRAGNAWLYVEPDGDVLPHQGEYVSVLGNLVTDPWEAIWQKLTAK